MNILLTNDDGIYAPGIAALKDALARLGNVYVVAPQTEQSGVGHQITFLTPLTIKKLYAHDIHWGWAVEGSPADCVKIAINEICPVKPDIVVSGINGGLNAGINVLYSGTVSAAIEAGFFGIDSVAVSLESVEPEPPYERAAAVASSVIEQILAKKSKTPQIYSMNIPCSALEGEPRVKICPMDTRQYWEKFEQRVDPFGRTYFWLTGKPAPGEKPDKNDMKTNGVQGNGENLAEFTLSDIEAIGEGYISLTPLSFDMTHLTALREMQNWEFNLSNSQGNGVSSGLGIKTRRFI